MAKKEFTYKGKTLEELQTMEISEIAKLLPSRERRKIKRGFTDSEKIFYREINKRDGVRTHCRDAVVLPSMVTKKVNVYSGKEFSMVIIQPEMIGHRLGEFVSSRKPVHHNAPGVGATKSSAAMSVK